MKLVSRSFITTCLFLGTFFTAVQASQSVTVTTLTDYSPFTFGVEGSVKNEKIPPGYDSASLQGYDWDILRSSFHAVGVTVELSVVPWSRGVSLLEAGKTDILFPTTKTDKRIEMGYHFSEQPVHTIKNVLYVKADSNLQWDGDIDTLRKVLKGKNVGVRRGFSYGTLWESEVEKLRGQIQKANDDSMLFKMLRSGRVDFVIAYDIPTDFTLRQMGMTDSFKKIGNVGTSTEYIATHGTKGSVEAVDLFNKGFAIITGNGKLEAIRAKWGQSNFATAETDQDM